MILLVYFLTTVSLPVFRWCRQRVSFSPLRQVAIPVLGSVTLIVPFTEPCQPGQAAPYSAFPFITLAIVAAATAIACLVVPPPARRSRRESGIHGNLSVAPATPLNSAEASHRHERDLSRCSSTMGSGVSFALIAVPSVFSRTFLNFAHARGCRLT